VRAKEENLSVTNKEIIESIEGMTRKKRLNCMAKEAREKFLLIKTKNK